MSAKFTPQGIAAGVAAAISKTIIGDEQYNDYKSRATWSWSAFQGISPVPTFLPLIPVKIVLMIILILICIYVFNLGWWSLPVAYAGQAMIITIISYFFLNKLLSWYGV